MTAASFATFYLLPFPQCDQSILFRMGGEALVPLSPTSFNGRDM
jgi:hypothetical protein